MIDETHCEFFETNTEVCVEDLHGPGELLFARKFSDDGNLHLLERIDEMVRRKEKATSPSSGYSAVSQS
jgi:hypothetical protein